VSCHEDEREVARHGQRVVCVYEAVNSIIVSVGVGFLLHASIIRSHRDTAFIRCSDFGLTNVKGCILSVIGG